MNTKLDDIHMQSKLVYQKPANRRQCFMSSSIMSPMCLFLQFEYSCLELEYQKRTLIGTTEQFIINNDKYGRLLLLCDVCEAKITTIVTKALFDFTHILLNDYATAQQ